MAEPNQGAEMPRYFEWTEGKIDRLHKSVEIVAADDVNDEILAFAEEVEEGWFSDEPQIDWERFWDKLEGYEVPSYDGREIDMGSDIESPAMRKIKKHIRAYRNS
jgi:hypothetical protein